jgi:hypothetical protein
MASAPSNMAPVTVNTTARGGVIRINDDPAREVIAPLHSGGATRTLAAIAAGTPTVSIDTLNAYEWLGILAASGPLPYLTLTDLKWIARVAANNSPGNAAGSIHEQGAATAGILAFTGLSVAPRQPATMSLIAYLTAATSATDPVTYSQVAAPADPGVVTAMTLDSLTIDSTTIEDVLGVDIACSIDWTIRRGVGWAPTFVHPKHVDWTMTIRHENKTIPRTKGDKAANAVLALKNYVTGGPTLGTSIQTWTVTGLVHQAPTSMATENPNEVTTIVRGRFNGSVEPATWANT